MGRLGRSAVCQLLDLVQLFAISWTVALQVPLSMKWLDDIIDSMDMNMSKLREMVKDRAAWWATVHGVTES